MLDIITYALLRKQIATAASGISDVRAEGDELVFVLADGRELVYAPSASPSLPLSVVDGMLQITYEEAEQQ